MESSNSAIPAYSAEAMIDKADITRIDAITLMAWRIGSVQDIYDAFLFGRCGGAEFFKSDSRSSAVSGTLKAQP